MDCLTQTSAQEIELTFKVKGSAQMMIKISVESDWLFLMRQKFRIEEQPIGDLCSATSSVHHHLKWQHLLPNKCKCYSKFVCLLTYEICVNGQKPYSDQRWVLTELTLQIEKITFERIKPRNCKHSLANT